MIRRFLPQAIVVATVTAAWPSVAADEHTVTGLSNTGIGLFFVTIACSLLLTFLCRTSASRVVRRIMVKIGKYRIHKTLRKHSANVLDDFILPGAYGGLTRIDHAILTSGGILCIQAKHYSGVISGDSREPQWTNIDGARRRKFLNPLIQNEGRTKALRKIAVDVPVVNLVVFTGVVKLASSVDQNVIHVRDLDSYIANYDSDTSKVDDLDALWMTLKSAAMVDEETRKDFDAQLSFS